MTSVLVKLDENLGRAHVALLRAAGMAADRVHDQGLSGAGDDELWQRVQAEGRFFITRDLDFSDVRQIPPGTHAGLLLLRPSSRDRQTVLDILQRILDEHELQGMRGCVVVADERSTRIRRPKGSP